MEYSGLAKFENLTKHNRFAYLNGKNLLKLYLFIFISSMISHLMMRPGHGHVSICQLK